MYSSRESCHRSTPIFEIQYKSRSFIREPIVSSFQCLVYSGNKKFCILSIHSRKFHVLLQEKTRARGLGDESGGCEKGEKGVWGRIDLQRQKLKLCENDWGHDAAKSRIIHTPQGCNANPTPPNAILFFTCPYKRQTTLIRIYVF